MFLLNDENCGKYVIRMTRPRLSEWDGENVFCLFIMDNTVFDIKGRPFPEQRACVAFAAKFNSITSFAHTSADISVMRRPQSRFYGTFLSVGYSTVPMTMDSDVLLMLAFSERVEGFHDSLVKVRIGQSRVVWTSVVTGEQRKSGLHFASATDKDTLLRPNLDSRRLLWIRFRFPLQGRHRRRNRFDNDCPSSSGQ